MRDAMSLPPGHLLARGEDLALLDGQRSREATWDWLTTQGFPGQPEDLFLTETLW